MDATGHIIAYKTGEEAVKWQEAKSAVGRPTHASVSPQFYEAMQSQSFGSRTYESAKSFEPQEGDLRIEITDPIPNAAVGKCVSDTEVRAAVLVKIEG